jgi:hypothetical protein
MHLCGLRKDEVDVISAPNDILPRFENIGDHVT